MFKDFPISFKLPTEEEMIENTRKSWEMVKPVLLSELHPDILKLSMPTLFVKVPIKEVREEWLEDFDSKGRGKGLTTLKDHLYKALETYPEIFFKLDSRSPKDWGINKYTQDNIGEIVNNFFGSERMLDDIIVQMRHREHIILCFRQWTQLKNEFRVFVKDHRIQGISWYDYIGETLCFPKNHIKLQKKVEKDIAKMFSVIDKNMEISDYVYDIGYNYKKPILIELNPCGLSDPCCFGSYSEINGFKWTKE